MISESADVFVLCSETKVPSLVSLGTSMITMWARGSDVPPFPVDGGHASSTSDLGRIQGLPMPSFSACFSMGTPCRDTLATRASWDSAPTWGMATWLHGYMVGSHSSCDED